MVNRSAAQHAVKMLGVDHASAIIILAKTQDALERLWVAKAKKLGDTLGDEVIKALKEHGHATLDLDKIIDFLMEHYISVGTKAARGSEFESNVLRMAKPRLKPFERIMKQWDLWRKRRQATPKIRKQAEKIKKEYLKKAQAVWSKYSEDFRSGDEATQDYVLRKVKDAGNTVSSRAATIVRTETTNYYNHVRREIYDQSDAVTHYLFLAIRDQRTTKWCSEKTVDGKRGRHGLVYAKDDPLTQQETPACHWNCRSEMIPLSPFNPRHRKLIKNESLWRRNNACHPLPEGWR